MANVIRTSGILSSRFVDATSRYSANEVVYYGENNIITFKTYKRSPIVENANDRFMVITKGTEYRPDLVSQDAYSTPNFWWKLLEANGMMDILEFKTGTNIRIPAVESIFLP